MDENLERRLADVWADAATHIDVHGPEAFRSQIDALVASLPDDNPRRAFERACAFDSTGEPQQAVPLYREALALGISASERGPVIKEFLRTVGTDGRGSGAAYAAAMGGSPSERAAAGGTNCGGKRGRPGDRRDRLDESCMPFPDTRT